MHWNFFSTCAETSNIHVLKPSLADVVFLEKVVYSDCRREYFEWSIQTMANDYLNIAVDTEVSI